MEINQSNLYAFRDDFAKAVESLEEQYDVTISLGRITYVRNRFSGKLTVVNGRDPEIVARHQFDADVWKFERIGLRKGMYNRIFIAEDGEKYAIQGFNLRARKWPIKVLRLSDGEKRVCNEYFIFALLDEYYTEPKEIEEERLMIEMISDGDEDADI